jgi:hypothetical protein
MITGELVVDMGTPGRTFRGHIPAAATVGTAWIDLVVEAVDEWLPAPRHISVHGYSADSVREALAIAPPVARDPDISGLVKAVLSQAPRERLKTSEARRIEPPPGFDSYMVSVAASQSQVDPTLTSLACVTGAGWYIASHTHTVIAPRAIWMACQHGVAIYPGTSKIELLCGHQKLRGALVHALRGGPVDEHRLPPYLTTTDYERLKKSTRYLRVQVSAPKTGNDLHRQAQELARQTGRGELSPTTRRHPPTT